jgi:hypothetical protein
VLFALLPALIGAAAAAGPQTGRPGPGLTLVPSRKRRLPLRECHRLPRAGVRARRRSRNAKPRRPPTVSAALRAWYAEVARERSFRAPYLTFVCDQVRDCGMADQLIFYTHPMSRGRIVRLDAQGDRAALPHRAARLRHDDEAGCLSRDQSDHERFLATVGGEVWGAMAATTLSMIGKIIRPPEAGAGRLCCSACSSNDASGRACHQPSP